MGELLLVVNETVSCSSIHIDAGERVHLRVHPVQALVDHVCPVRDPERFDWLIWLMCEIKLLGSNECIREFLFT